MDQQPAASAAANALAAPTSGMARDEAAGVPSGDGRAPLGVREQVALSFFWFASNFQSSALLPIVIPAQVLLFIPGAPGSANQAIFLGWLSAAGSVTALVVVPVVGAISDHTPGPLGRRRPYITVGTLLLLAGMVGLASRQALVVFIVGLLVVQLGGNISGAAYQGLLPDRVPEAQRGTASGYMGLMTILGTVGSLAVAAILVSQVSAGAGQNASIWRGSVIYYLLTGIVLAIGLVVTLVGVHEVPLARMPRPAGAARDGAGERPTWRVRFARTWIEPWSHHNFAWVFLTRAFVILGLTLFMTFIEYYFASVAHVSNFALETAGLAVLALLGAVLSALTLGILSDRLHRRVPIVCVATVLMTVAALVFVVAPDSVPLWPLGLIFGLGYGAYTSVDWALAIDALPSLAAAGKDLGLWSIASTIPSILAPLVGAVVIGVADVFGQTALGYRATFALAGIFFLLGAGFVLKVRESGDTDKPRARREPGLDDAERALGGAYGA
jgi:MFS family permease